MRNRERAMDKKNGVYGYAGKILRVNLSNGNITLQPTLDYAREWIGSSGIAIKILYDELKSWVSPYDPANKFIFSAGALLGTTAPGACKANVSTLGPVTGGWASGCSDSYVGGQLKYAGYDSVVVEGKAHTPVYLWIHDEHVEIRDASHLWGKTTWETFDTLVSELGNKNLHTISIGPTGENLARGGCIIQDKGRAFGRCGSGAVMGSKNLKAIAVLGTGSIKVANPKMFMEAVNKAREMFKKARSREIAPKYGTLGIIEGKQACCGMNYKNFQELVIPDKMAEVVDPKKAVDRFQVARSSFPGCAIGCGRQLYITDGPFAGLKTEGSQWETFATLQTRLGISEPGFFFKANAYCNQLGLDVDLAGGALGWAFECYQRGIINEKDTDGFKLNWGDDGVVLELLRKIAYREGFGNLLAEGCAKAADIIGRNSSYFAMNIKGQDLYETCRGANAWCLATTTSTRGGGHTTGAPAVETLPGLDVEKARLVYGVDNPDKPMEYEGKAKMVHYMESVHRTNNSLGVCHINTTWWDVEHVDLAQLAELYSAATGWETSVEDLKRITMKQINLEKAFNLRFTNFARKDDLPTQRDLNEPVPTGSLSGWKIDEEKYNKMLDEYYDLHGWDRETSFPKRKTLIDLDLEYVADDLEKIGKLG